MKVSHILVREAGEALEGGSPPQRNALSVHGGQVGAVGGPPYKGLCPEGALVHLLCLRPLCIVPADLCGVLIADHKLIAPPRVHHPVPKVLLHIQQPSLKNHTSRKQPKKGACSIDMCPISSLQS